jgi:hypothetical protein
MGLEVGHFCIIRRCLLFFGHTWFLAYVFSPIASQVWLSFVLRLFVIYPPSRAAVF